MSRAAARLPHLIAPDVACSRGTATEAAIRPCATKVPRDRNRGLRRPPTMRRCASSTPTATSTPTASPTTPTWSSGPPVSRAWSGSSCRAGTSRRRSGRSTSSTASPGSTRRSASIRTTPPRSTTRAGRSIGAWARDERVVAIGETGLDYDRVFSPIDDQLTNLRRNLALAADTGKPAILHCRSAAGRRDAQDALLAELAAGRMTPRRRSGAAPVVIHSFSGPVDYARAMLDLGLPSSASPASCSGRARRLRPTSRRSRPLDRLLVETDSPFLAPPGAPRSRNEPE